MWNMMVVWDWLHHKQNGRIGSRASRSSFVMNGSGIAVFGWMKHTKLIIAVVSRRGFAYHRQHNAWCTVMQRVIAKRDFSATSKAFAIHLMRMSIPMNLVLFCWGFHNGGPPLDETSFRTAEMASGRGRPGRWVRHFGSGTEMKRFKHCHTDIPTHRIQ